MKINIMNTIFSAKSSHFNFLMVFACHCFTALELLFWAPVFGPNGFNNPNDVTLVLLRHGLQLPLPPLAEEPLLKSNETGKSDS